MRPHRVLYYLGSLFISVLLLLSAKICQRILKLPCQTCVLTFTILQAQLKHTNQSIAC